MESAKGDRAQSFASLDNDASPVGKKSNLKLGMDAVLAWNLLDYLEKKLYKNFTKIHGGNEKNELFRVLGLSHG